MQCGCTAGDSAIRCSLVPTVTSRACHRNAAELVFWDRQDLPGCTVRIPFAERSKMLVLQHAGQKGCAQEQASPSSH